MLYSEMLISSTYNIIWFTTFYFSIYIYMDLYGFLIDYIICFKSLLEIIFSIHVNSTIGTRDGARLLFSE